MAHDDAVDVLLVDDNPTNLTALEAILAAPGLRLVAARSGKEALRCLLQRDFAVILLDVNMPVMDGFDTALLIRQRKRSEHTPIIFVTAFADDTHVARGYSIGAADYILTPVVPDVLRAKVAVFVDLFRKTEEVKRHSESLKRRASQLHALTNASLAINSARTVDDIAQHLARRAREMLDAAAVAAVVRPTPGQAARAVSLADGRRPPDDDALVDGLVAAAEPATADATPTVGDPAARTIVELTARDGRRFGRVAILPTPEGAFDDEDRSVIAQLAQIAAIAVENVLYAQEREANRLKDEFLATVSHELRTPLSAVLSWVRILRTREADGATIARGLEVIERNARAQTRLIDDLLDMSRVVAGKLQLEAAPVDLHAAIGEAIESVGPLAAARRIELGRDLAPIAGRCNADGKRLQQVLWNLLTNAIKFSPEGAHVGVVLRDRGDAAEISVVDDGRGIAPAFLPYVFEQFRQADTSITRAQGGLGIGLAIVRRIVELHGGTVRAESAGEGRGATFTVTFPVGATPSQVQPEPANDAERGAASLRGLRVLVVDDDADGRDAVAVLLESAGADVTTADSAASAMHAILASPPDVLVSDIGMPGEDGYSLIQRIRALDPERGGDVAAIALTAYTRSQDRARAFAAGYQAHVSKPVDSSELLAALIALGVIARARHQPPPAAAAAEDNPAAVSQASLRP